MTNPDDAARPGSAASVRQVRWVPLTGRPLTCLVAGDLAGARARTGLDLPEFFVSEQARRLWRRRFDQVTADPASAPWVVRAAVSEPDGAVVGYAGYHGPPDADGVVEIGYTVVPEARRRGYARAMLRSLLLRAAEEPGVNVVRVTISPDNVASLATIRGFGFVEMGEEMDEEDGLGIIHEVPADRIVGDRPPP
ncbi:GNAT family N-acetyltransferase [Embleya scabrispora]|uniref:GNAT family N-acetyltransferase n=1 Tax=Embleya scabrispora TaxID=159449 RepID=A0A1T3NJU3_9ACTN|nr:GNAT family N-acetyltransferase [Embleya scabrispora]OPC77113.1 GNAT family N-acetyltransferase [Embleya scabrispora]